MTPKPEPDTQNLPPLDPEIEQEFIMWDAVSDEDFATFEAALDRLEEE